MSTPNRGHRLGYARVSSEDQNTVRQLDGLSFDKVFTDKVSGGKANRPQLTALLGHARKGDTVVVHSMDRLARNLDDLRALVNRLTEKGVRVEFIKEGLTFPGEDSAMSRLLLSVMGAFAEFERALIRERQREGIKAAKKAGVYKGRKKLLSAAQVTDLRQRAESGESKASLARDFGVSRETVYQYFKAAPDA
ncbi:recombinase family protein [Deinococcus radiopugnans]|uniref:DNA invertase Pin-like site-specific DNA recombinase n=1 Tax=Deinococcus radiopugnans ATCC 19172 TaxID=585398 RepID=A0A5C4XGQ1_9DEIO|nr:recombinase family protein [Deinococcus radiopugnans]MBB6018866.1 DNA invertase Pin-like site-specific DNA recombinase [Deinococcus radiopugnans ATCC 19172]TNM62488.1 recombinase family protein [Deinococcus radiopugnans ATCC 19172]